MIAVSQPDASLRTGALALATFGFIVSFSVWTTFSIVGLQIKKDLELNDSEFGLLIGTPILTGSLIRLLLGIWTEQLGGRTVMSAVLILSGAAMYLMTFASGYPTFLLAAVGVGIAGGYFSAGIAYVSKWFPKNLQGTALGVFGLGNLGAAITTFSAPFVLASYGWQTVGYIWGAASALVGVAIFLMGKDEPQLIERRKLGTPPPSLLSQIAPLRELRVWRFSLYYFFVFGGFVALSLWLPRYLMGAYDLDLKTAGLYATVFALPAGLSRALGGILSDRFGARRIMYVTFGVAAVSAFVLSYPATDYVVRGINGPIEFSLAIGLKTFLVILFVLGFFMSLGSAAVYKHIPAYYPDRVGSVGGVVGMIGGLGGFSLPLAFGVMNDLVGVWTSCFMLLFALVSTAFIWMHVTILTMEHAAYPKLKGPKDLPELGGALGARSAGGSDASIEKIQPTTDNAPHGAKP